MLSLNSGAIFGTLLALMFGSAMFGAFLSIPQYFLCKIKSKWLGLLLPSISFIFSVFFPASTFFLYGSSMPNPSFLFLLFFTMNICTLILLSIYWYMRKDSQKTQILKMTIEDLE